MNAGQFSEKKILRLIDQCPDPGKDCAGRQVQGRIRLGIVRLTAVIQTGVGIA
jgi:hypothetical protein